MSRPLVSVIIPVYNEEKTIEKGLKSLLDQDYPNIEVICVDDGSEDRSREIIKDMKSDNPEITLIKNEKNLGITRTLNKGLEEAEGDLIARQDANDLSKPERISKQVKYMRKNPDKILCGQYSDTVSLIDEEGRVIQDFVNKRVPDIKKLRCSNMLIHSSIMFRKGLRYREKFRYAQDYDLYLRLLSEDQNQLAVLSEDLVQRRLERESMGIEGRPKQKYCAEKAKEYFQQRTEKGQDNYEEDEFEIPDEERKQTDKNFAYDRGRMRKALEAGNIEYARRAYQDYISNPETDKLEELKYLPIVKSNMVLKTVKKLGIRGF